MRVKNNAWGRHIPVEGHSTTYLTSSPPNCQGLEKQGEPDQPSQPREAPGDRMIYCHVASWMALWNRKRTLDKN